MEKFFGNLNFGPIHNSNMCSQLHFSIYGLAVRNVEGQYVAYDEAQDDIINVDIFDLDIPEMIWAIPAALKDVSKGDIIYHNKHFMFVKENKGTSLDVVDISNGTIISVIPTKNMFNFNFVTKIICPFGKLTADEDNPFGNILPFMLLGKDNFNMRDMLMFSMMNDSNTFDMSNPLLMMMLLSKKEYGNIDDVDPFVLMMMMQSQQTK